jgi:hypothetical protein
VAQESLPSPCLLFYKQSAASSVAGKFPVSAMVSAMVRPPWFVSDYSRQLKGFITLTVVCKTLSVVVT